MLEDLFYVGAHILKTYIDPVKNTILAQIGSVIENYTFSDNAEVWQTWGFSSRPSPPVSGTSAAEGIVLRSDRDRIVAGRDIRAQAIYGNLKDGETCMFATGADGNGQARVLEKQDGSVTIYTTDNNKASGNAVYLRLAPQALTFVAPWGTLTFDPTGFHVNTNGGPSIDLASFGIPGVPSNVSSAVTGSATISAPIVNCAGNLVLLGNGPNFAPVCQAPMGSGPPVQLNLFTGPGPAGNQAASVQVTVP